MKTAVAALAALTLLCGRPAAAPPKVELKVITASPEGFLVNATLITGARDAVQGFAKYINSKAGGGGLAGRKVVVDFIDSKLNGDETRNAIIKACQNAFDTSPGFGRSPTSSSKRSSIPTAAACHASSTLAPRSTSRRATSQHP